MKKEIPVARLKHCYMVGKVMEYVAREIYNMQEETVQEMFFLGYIHDSMYDFEDDESKHNEILSKIVCDKYSRCVLEHSRIGDYRNIALDLIYFADQIVDGEGNVCSFEKRLQDILDRHSLEDGVYQDSVDIVNYLKRKGFEETERKVLAFFSGAASTNPEEKYVFTVEWESGSMNDNIIKYLKEKNISFGYNQYFVLVADLFRTGRYYKFDYEHIHGNVYGVTATEVIN